MTFFDSKKVYPQGVTTSVHNQLLSIQILSEKTSNVKNILKYNNKFSGSQLPGRVPVRELETFLPVLELFLKLQNFEISPE
jgi:hypothetical protein